MLRPKSSKMRTRKTLTSATSESLTSELIAMWPDWYLNRNQRVFTNLLGQLLAQLPGHGPDNFGSMVLNVRVGMRDKHGTIIREQYAHTVHESIRV